MSTIVVRSEPGDAGAEHRRQEELVDGLEYAGAGTFLGYASEAAITLFVQPPLRVPRREAGHPFSPASTQYAAKAVDSLLIRAPMW